jgi:hypothetical protein
MTNLPSTKWKYSPNLYEADPERLDTIPTALGDLNVLSTVKIPNTT